MMLSVIDNNWKHHLRAMDELKDNVQMASFEQKDPLVIYKKAAYQQFEGLISEVQREVASFLFQWSIPMPSAEELEAIQQQALYEHEQRQKLQEREMQQLHTNFEEVEMPNKRQQDAPQQQSKQPIPPFVNIDPKVGRNDNCPCGSGKKFKQCHGKNL
jgi:preprotein translocase subunit SecA